MTRKKSKRVRKRTRTRDVPHPRAADPDGEQRTRPRRKPATMAHGTDVVADVDGVTRKVRVRHAEMSLHQSRSRANKKIGTGLPRKRRVPGTNGSFPAHDVGEGAPPKPPAILALYPDLFEDEIDNPEAVFGQYPRRLISKLAPYFRGPRSQILHVCSGSLPRGEGIRVDIRPEAKPDILADGRRLPFADGSFDDIMFDPPYTPQYARDLYGVEYPRPSHLLREGARVLKPCGRMVFVHYIVPQPPPGCVLVRVLAASTGYGFPMRAITIFEREQGGLWRS